MGCILSTEKVTVTLSPYDIFKGVTAIFFVNNGSSCHLVRRKVENLLIYCFTLVLYEGDEEEDCCSGSFLAFLSLKTILLDFLDLFEGISPLLQF